MFFLTYTDLNLIKVFIKKWVDDMKMKKHTDKSQNEGAPPKKCILFISMKKSNYGMMKGEQIILIFCFALIILVN